MRKNKKMTKSEISILLVMMFFAFLMLVIIYNVQSNKSGKMQILYPEISFATSFSSNLKEINMEMGLMYKGRLFIDLSNNRKYSLPGNLWNRKYSPNNFYDFVQVGDSIYKPANSYEIFIYRNKQEYLFYIDR